MSRYKKMFGKIGEDYAVEYLEGKGYEVIGRNVFVGRGEIDIVCKRNNLVVFVEVKTRRSDEYIDILDLIDSEKEKSLISVCEKYLDVNDYEGVEYRIDLIGLVIKDCVVEKFEHVEGII